MRGLSTLSASRAKQKAKGLTTLQGRMTSHSDFYNLNNGFLQQTQSKGYYPCAYHVGQRITNFCVNSNCLLPLCPKCIKIHSQQHEKMGIHGNFATVEQCIYECQNTQNESTNRLQEILKVCEQMSVLHKQQLLICRDQLQKAKQQMLDYINNVFAFYQEQADKIIIQTSREYQQQLVVYHKEISTLVVTEKQLAKKAQNPNLKLEFLIDFYSKPDLSTLLNGYAARIQNMKPQYFQLNINTYELQRIKVIIKKYLDFGPFSQLIEHKLENNLSYQRVTMVSKKPQPSHRKQNSYSSAPQNNESLKQFVRSPIKNLFSTPSQAELKINGDSYELTQKGQIAKMIEEKLNRESMLDRFQSPLESYSLQKSRKNRM